MSDEAVWDDEDDQNVVGLIRICEDLKTRLVPYGASAEGWGSAIRTLHRVKRITGAESRSLRSPSTETPDNG